MTSDPDDAQAVLDYPAPPFPEDATMFYCIGAQKAGTSWLYDYLAQSDEVHFSPNKELHYFDVRAGRAEQALQLRISMVQNVAAKLSAKTGQLNRPAMKQLRETANLLNIYTGGGTGPNRHRPYITYLLAARRNQKVVGDITPAYAILNRENFADMASIGRAKFIFILRDPISRMWSQIRMSVALEQGPQATPEMLAEQCRARAELLIQNNRLSRIERTNYMHTLTELEAAVPEDRRLYVFYEELFDGDAPQQICDFLGITPPQVDGTKRVNEGVRIDLPEDIRALFRRAFAPQYDGIQARFGDRLPAKWQV